MTHVSLVREAVCKTVVARVRIPGASPIRPVVQRTGPFRKTIRRLQGHAVRPGLCRLAGQADRALVS
jgi:hypothetical protein